MAPSTDPAQETSKDFNAEDADVVLISSDQTRFKVHKANLVLFSPVFKSMFEVSTSNDSEKVATVELTETKDTLSVLLPFFYPSGPQKLIELRFPSSWELVRAVEKYEMPAAVALLAGAFFYGLHDLGQAPKCLAHDAYSSDGSTSKSIRFMCASALFACHFQQLGLLRQSLQRLLALSVGIDLLKSTLQIVSKDFCSPEASTKIIETLQVEFNIVDNKRRSLNEKLTVRSNDHAASI